MATFTFKLARNRIIDREFDPVEAENKEAAACKLLLRDEADLDRYDRQILRWIVSVIVKGEYGDEVTEYTKSGNRTTIILNVSA